MTPEGQAFVKALERKIRRGRGGNGMIGCPRSVIGIARSCGITHQALCHYMSGRREPKLSTAMRIAKHLGIKLDRLENDK